jgi:hypothetical protein
VKISRLIASSLVSTKWAHSQGMPSAVDINWRISPPIGSHRGFWAVLFFLSKGTFPLWSPTHKKIFQINLPLQSGIQNPLLQPWDCNNYVVKFLSWINQIMYKKNTKSKMSTRQPSWILGSTGFRKEPSACVKPNRTHKRNSAKSIKVLELSDGNKIQDSHSRLR